MCEAAPAIIMQAAAVTVTQAPRNVSSRAQRRSANRSFLSAMQLCWKKSCQGATVVPTMAITRKVRSAVMPPGGMDGRTELLATAPHSGRIMKAI